MGTNVRYDKGMVGELLTLTAALEELAAVDVDTVTDAELHDAVVGLGTLSTRLEAQWCRLIGRWDGRHIWADNGSKAAAARLARETRWRRGDCDRLVGRARDLTRMPHTEAAYRAGGICGRHVDLVASCDREWRHANFNESEEFLVTLCRTPFFTVAQRGIDYWKLCADLDAADRDADTVHAGRHLSASVTFNGTVAIDGVLDPLGGEVLKTELDRICEQLRLQDLRDGVERTATQRRADALVEMAMRSATAPADGLRPRSLLSVTIGIDPFNHLCQTSAGTVVAPGLLIPYLSDADIERIVYDPPRAVSKRPGAAASAGPCAASSRSATSTANIRVDVTNLLPAATPITSCRTVTAASPVSAKASSNACTTTASTKQPPTRPPTTTLLSPKAPIPARSPTTTPATTSRPPAPITPAAPTPAEHPRPKLRIRGDCDTRTYRRRLGSSQQAMAA